MPSTNCTEEVIFEAIKNSWEAIKYINKDKQTTKVCLEAITGINGSWEAIKYINKDKQTDEMIIEGLKQNNDTIGYVNNDPKIWTSLLDKHLVEIEKIPRSVLEEMYLMERANLLNNEYINTIKEKDQLNELNEFDELNEFYVEI